MRIYVASSWRNLYQPAVVAVLRTLGHDVYDFKNPAQDNHGFGWSQIDPAWRQWNAAEYRKALQHPIAVKGWGHDIGALTECEACLLVLPSGRSASWELGFAMAGNKYAAVFMPEACEPELMYRGAEILGTWEELRSWGSSR